MITSNERRRVWTSEGKIYVQDQPVITYDVSDGIYRLKTFANKDATPDVTNGVIFKTANTSNTTITDFDGSMGDGHRIMIVIYDDYTTIAHNENINMPGDVSVKFNKYEIAEFVSVGGVWIGRIPLLRAE